MREFESAEAAMRHVMDAVSDVLSAGWEFEGIDPAQVRVRASRQEVEVTPGRGSGGYTGDLSVCCGAPVQQTGTCGVCTGCGTSTGGCG